jgi:hypothetical protein
VITEVPGIGQEAYRYVAPPLPGSLLFAPDGNLTLEITWHPFDKSVLPKAGLDQALEDTVRSTMRRFRTGDL